MSFCLVERSQVDVQIPEEPDYTSYCRDMFAAQLLRRQVARGTMRSGLRLWESGLHSWTATQFCRTQQIARFHQLITRRRPFFRNTVRWNSSRPTPDPTKHLGSPAPQSFFQRFKQLGKEYGWVVTGVYLGLSALDLPFCFLAVRWLGTERVGRWEHAIVGSIKNAVKSVMPDVGQKTEEVATEVESSVVDAAAREGAGWGVEEADARNQSEEACKFSPLSIAPSLLTFYSKALWTQFVLAYAIHKSFIFLRVPLAVAVTPKVVKTLRGWGWQIGKRKLKQPKP